MKGERHNHATEQCLSRNISGVFFRLTFKQRSLIIIEGKIEMKILFVEPPKDVWFVMGEYLPPPYGIIQLAAYLEKEVKNLRESLKSSQDAVLEFQKASGVLISKWDAGHIGNAVRVVSQGPAQVLSYLQREKEHLGRMAKVIDEALEDLGANNASSGIQ